MMMNFKESEPTCDCCEGIQPITPQSVANRPGSPSLAYRVGIHATFLETMLASLSQTVIDIPTNQLDAQGQPLTERYTPLDGLRTRSTDDPAIALLDAWATAADVLTFYQERIANEGYLRTATERRSLLELGRLVGYSLRPGVSASAFVAFTLDKESRVTIPEGSRVQSVPAPGEMPQFFETSEPLEARAEWSILKPRTRQPQYITAAWLTPDKYIYIEPPNPPLKANDAVLVDFGIASERELFRVLEATPLSIPAPEPGEPPLDVVRLRLQSWQAPATPTQPAELKLRELLLTILERYTEVSTFGISPDSPTTREVIRLLQAFKAKIDPLTDAQLAADISSFLSLLATLLSDLQAVFDPLDPRFVRLREWLGDLLGELRIIERTIQVLMMFAPVHEQPGQGDAVEVVLQAIAGIQRLLDDLDAFPVLAALLRPELTQTLVSLTRMMRQGRGEGELKTGGDIATPRLAFTRLLAPLRKAPALHPGSPRKLSRPASKLFRYDGDLVPHLVTALDERLAQAYTAWGSATAPMHAQRPGTIVAQGAGALRVQAAFFGHNLAGRPVFARDGEDTLYIDHYTSIGISDVWPSEHEDFLGQPVIYLDREYSQVEQGSWLVIERGGDEISASDGTMIPRLSVHRVTKVQKASLSFLANSAEVSRLELDPPWMVELDEVQFSGFAADSDVLRLTRVYAQSDALVLPLAPIDEEISGSLVELDGLYDGLQPGRWLVVCGERMDIPGVTGVFNSELVMLANVIQGTQMLDEQTSLPGDSPHTFIQLSSGGLAYRYKRGTLKIYANVVKATHGETRSEVLGSGNGARSYQAFELKQPPLTYVAAPNAEGVESTLKLRVNDVLWHLAPNLASLAPGDRRYILKTDDEGKTRVIFGDGARGARLPTGVENVRAEYRTGIGKGGNVKARQISLLVSRPLGVKEVINPLPASGGADRESRDQARKRLPLALMALDRLVSVQDYEDFARTFAGIGKASAVRLSDGMRTLVHLTIAGEDDIPIDVNSDLNRNFVSALRRLGDPFQPFEVMVREKVPLVIEAGVKINPDYLWEKVEGQVRTALLEAFGFENRELGQDVTSSEVLSVAQAVRGVEFVDLDVLDSLDEARLTRFLELQGEVVQKGDPGVTGAETTASLSSSLNLQLARRLRAEKARPSPDDLHVLLPAQILYLDAQVQDTLILKELI